MCMCNYAYAHFDLNRHVRCILGRGRDLSREREESPRDLSREREGSFAFHTEGKWLMLVLILLLLVLLALPVWTSVTWYTFCCSRHVFWLCFALNYQTCFLMCVHMFCFRLVFWRLFVLLLSDMFSDLFRTFLSYCSDSCSHVVQALFMAGFCWCLWFSMLNTDFSL
jgi:small-conductance mechanosensitive channel